MITCQYIDKRRGDFFVYEVLSKNEIRELDFCFDGKKFTFKSNPENPIRVVFKNQIGEIKFEGMNAYEKIKKTKNQIVSVKATQWGKNFKKNTYMNSRNYLIEEVKT